MEGANRGPYAKLLKLNNGHYKRIVDPVVPELFLKCNACCIDDTSIINMDLMVQEMNFQETKNNVNGLEGHEKLNRRFNGGENENYNSPQMGSDNHELSKTDSISNYYETSEEEYGMSNGEDDTDGEIDNEQIAKGRTKEMKEKITMEDEAKSFGINLKKLGQEDGFPVLFYTKTRENPALMRMTVDRDMQVIYMKRNKYSRFFPIKLIEKIVTSPEKIEGEFSRQIKKDPNIKIGNMVLFKASNFTDSVAIQFSDEQTKSNFINEVMYIKDLINNELSYY